MDLSIYQLIANAINGEGELDESFHLPDEQKENELKFAPGALDGIMLYHMGQGEFDPENVDYLELINMIKLGAMGKIEEALEEAQKFAQPRTVLPHIDHLLQYIRNHAQEIDPNHIYILSFRLMMEGRTKEAVKLGLALMELFDTDQNEEVKKVIRTLALSDEFSFYAGFHMSSWDNGNEEIFCALQKVHGWGRIFLIPKFEPQTQQMKSWLLKHGVDNTVIPAYSALDCYEKTNLLSLLRNSLDHNLHEPLDYERYRGISEIMKALFDEAPVPGISAIEENERKELLQRFVEATSKRTDLKGQDYEAILDLIDYLEELKENPEDFAENPEDSSENQKEYEQICESAKALLTQKAVDIIMRELEQGESFFVARRMGLEYQPYAYHFVIKDLNKYSWWASVLIQEDYRADEIIRFIEDTVDLTACLKETIEDGDKKGMHHIIELVLQALREKPAKGEIFVQTSLSSQRKDLRTRAVVTLESWIEYSGKNLREISPHLYQHLYTIATKEDDEALKNRMNAILNNTY